MATANITLPRTSSPALADRKRLGKGHWLVCAMDATAHPKYSPDGDHWYSLDDSAGKLLLYDADLWVDITTNYGLLAQQIPIHALAGVSGGILHRRARTLEAKSGTV